MQSQLQQAHGLDGRHALALEDAAELALHQPHAVDPALVRVLGDVLQGPVEVVEDGEQLADERGVGEADQQLAVLLGPSLVVRVVGGSALPGV